MLVTVIAKGMQSCLINVIVCFSAKFWDKNLMFISARSLIDE